jgi:hypothetical protein
MVRSLVDVVDERGFHQDAALEFGVVVAREYDVGL